MVDRFSSGGLVGPNIGGTRLCFSMCGHDAGHICGWGQLATSSLKKSLMVRALVTSTASPVSGGELDSGCCSSVPGFSSLLMAS